MAKQNRKQAAELKLEGQFGNYRVYTSGTYSEVRGITGAVIKRIRGTYSRDEALIEAESLSKVLALV